MTESEDRARYRARGHRLLLAVLAVALAVRVAACAAIAPSGLVNDEIHYFLAGTMWASGTPLDVSRPPLMVLLSGLVASGVNDSLAAARGAQVVLGTVIVALFFMVGREIDGRRLGLVSAAIAAAYPTFIGFSHYLLSETLYLVFSMLATWLLLRQRGARSSLELAAIGVLCGLAALTREIGVALVGGAALWVFWMRRARPRRALAAGLLVGVTAAAVIAPWSAYIHHQTGEFALVSRTSWMNLYLGNPAPGRRVYIPTYLKLGESASEREAEAQRLALEAIRARLPLWPLEKLVEIRDLMRPTSFPVKHLLAAPGPSLDVGSWRYRFAWSALDHQALRVFAALVAALSYVAVAILGAVGIVLSRKREEVAVLAWMALLHVLPVILTFATTRFRMPIEPFLVLGTAILLATGRTDWRAAPQGRRAAALAGGAAMVILLGLGADAFLSPTHF
jgi:4-amino-4-deoxy-L-arabinose transferase-like glycosyltransferase